MEHSTTPLVVSGRSYVLTEARAPCVRADAVGPAVCACVSCRGGGAFFVFFSRRVFLALGVARRTGPSRHGRELHRQTHEEERLWKKRDMSFWTSGTVPSVGAVGGRCGCARFFGVLSDGGPAGSEVDACVVVEQHPCARSRSDVVREAIRVAVSNVHVSGAACRVRTIGQRLLVQVVCTYALVLSWRARALQTCVQVRLC